MWLLGVQREANEIKRTLDEIPAGIKKPKATDIAQLSLGQFYAAWGKQIHQVYVQPAWMDELEAMSVAMGERAPAPPPKPAAVEIESEDEMSLDREYMDRTTTLLERVVGLLENHAQHHDGVPPADPAAAARMASLPGAGSGADEAALYQRFVARLRTEAPALLKLLAEVPEIHLTIQRPVVEMDTTTLRGKIVKLAADGFFDKGTNGGQVITELGRQGQSVFKGTVYDELRDLAGLGLFTVEEQGNRTKVFTRVADVKIVRKEK